VAHCDPVEEIDLSESMSGTQEEFIVGARNYAVNPYDRHTGDMDRSYRSHDLETHVLSL
jgi:hypothetical protein